MDKKYTIPFLGACSTNPAVAEGIAPNAGAILSDAEIQAATDSIHIAEFGAGKGKGIPISVTVSAEGRVVVSQVGRLPGPAARARAIEIFGENVEFVKGTANGNAPGVRGADAEARGIHHLKEDAQGARQAATHYACPYCEARQNAAGVVNITGTQSQHGHISRPIGGH